jgi:TRAP-type C4-dicarboxylate transport system permease small subunit
LIAAVFFFSFGTLLSWLGWRHWRYRKEETISLIEAAILKTTGAEPLPRTRLDRFLTYLQAILGFVFGAFFLLIGILAVLNELGAL